MTELQFLYETILVGLIEFQIYSTYSSLYKNILTASAKHFELLHIWLSNAQTQWLHIWHLSVIINSFAE